MKKLKTKILNVMLVSVLGFATVGGLMWDRREIVSAEDGIPAPSSVFYGSASAKVSPYSSDTSKTAFYLPDGGKISFRRDLALQWYEENVAKYLSMEFSFPETIAFETLTFTFETAPANSNKDDKAINNLVFAWDGAQMTAKVNHGASTVISHTGNIVMSLSDLTPEGEYTVNIGGTAIGTFENVGGTFSDYSPGKITPLVVQANFPSNVAEGTEAVVLFHELNGQEFALDADGKIAEDTAAPVLVMEEKIKQFTLGSEFTFAYQAIDVLDTSVDKTLSYYQYNPTDTEVEYKEFPTSKTYFSDMVYEKDGKNTTVYKEYGAEFFSVKVKLEDDAHTGDEGKTYDVSWYAEQVRADLGDGVSYVCATFNQVGPTVNANYSVNYQDLVDDAAALVNAGETSYIYLPSPLGMFEDDDTNNREIRYTVYYNSGTPSSAVNLKLSNLKIPVKTEGDYEIRIVAVDKSGNVMLGKNDQGEMVEVTAQNVWELTEIPSFTFRITNSDLSIVEDKLSLRHSSGTIESEFTVKEFEVEGPSGYTSHYALYYFDRVLFKQRYDVDVDETILAQVEFSAMRAQLVKDDDVAEAYAKAFGKALTLIVLGEEVDLTQVVDGEAVLRRIEEKKEDVSDDVFPDNKYDWDEETRTFIPAEAGLYVTIGAFIHPEQKGISVGAYHVIRANATEDIIKGESLWLQNNKMSIIFFSIAAVLLVIIVILFLVKPTDETLEDVDEVKEKEKTEETDEN